MDGGQNAPRSRLAASLLTLAAVVLWGFSPVGNRFMVGDGQLGLPPLPFCAARYLIAALALLPVLVFGKTRWSRRDWIMAAWCGVIGVTGYNLPATLGQKTVTAGMVGLLDGAEPLLIVLYGALRAGRMPAPMTIAAGLMGLAGVALLGLGAGPAEGDLAGIALVLLAALLWAIYCVEVPPLVARRGSTPVTAATVAFGTLPMLAAGGAGMPAMLAGFDTVEWGVLLALTIATSIVAMLCWNAGAAGLGAERAGWFLYLLPLIALLGGMLLLGEPVNAVELAGGALILISVWLGQR